MAPKFAPKVWKRPYTSIYNDNYRYGNSLYSDAVDEIERKYNEALARTSFRRDRPDLGLSTFADSQLMGESVARNLRTQAANDSLSNELTRTLSTERVNSYLEELEDSRLRRSASRRSMSRRPESAYYTRQSSYEMSTLNDDVGKPRDSFWMERCNELLKEVELVRLDLNESANKIKQEQAVLKGKTDREVTDLMITIEDQDRQLNDLQKQLRKQAKQVSDISLELQASQRQYQDVNEQLGQSQKRCLNLHHELEEMKNNLEKSHIYTSFAKELSKSTSTMQMPEHYNVKRDPRFQLME
ncbi:hypothetical protein HUG17_10308 [Dermatophagoides farinae]|uniref:Paramyosin n=1 Tax=Dermatophagoides farinae TaxID=6954 RepID=A0A9D4SC83_DERFA|nr:hypothetical protein HUG17_10308 [Dermatophagoides farinae]